ncbi:MAG: hypothetical protein WAM82_30665 [Thermoanaerobaculia bacterium]
MPLIRFTTANEDPGTLLIALADYGGGHGVRVVDRHAEEPEGRAARSAFVIPSSAILRSDS